MDQSHHNLGLDGHFICYISFLIYFEPDDVSFEFKQYAISSDKNLEGKIENGQLHSGQTKNGRNASVFYADDITWCKWKLLAAHLWSKTAR